MNFDEIYTLADRLHHALEGSLQPHSLHPIEKDLLRDKLKAIYSAVLSGNPGEPACQGDYVMQPIEETVSAAADSPAGEDVPVDEDIFPENSPAPSGQEIICKPERPHSGRADASAPGSHFEPEPGSIDAVQAESVPIRSKVDRKTILSLYQDEPAPVAAESPCSVPNDQQVQDSHGAATGSDASYQEPGNAPMSAEDKNLTVLGEVLGAGEQTLGEAYAENSSHTDMASKLGCSPVAELRKGIGINDKYMLVRDLFEGDSDLCERTLDALESFTDLDEALLYIHENYQWNPNSEAVKLIIDLLTRKLS